MQKLNFPALLGILLLLAICCFSTSAVAGKDQPTITRLATYQFLKGNHPLQSPLALVRDPHNGDLIVSSFENGEVVILDRNGALVQRLGKQAGLVSPYGVALDPKGRIYVSEVQTGKLKIFAPAGLLLDEINLSTLYGHEVAPGRISLGEDLQVYIVDLNSNQILILSADSTQVRAFGTFGYLQKVATGPDGVVIGLSGKGDAVTVFNAQGEVLRHFGQHGDETERNVSFPSGFAIDNNGRVWIADAFQHRLKVFSLSGDFLFNFGRLEVSAGGFFFPVDLCFGNDGILYVLEKGANRIQVFQVEDLYDKAE